MKTEQYFGGQIAETKSGELTQVLTELLPEIAQNSEELEFTKNLVEGFIRATEEISVDLRNYGIKPFLDKKDDISFIHPKIILANQQQCESLFGPDYDKQATADLQNGTIILNIEQFARNCREIRSEIFLENRDEFTAKLNYDKTLKILLLDLVTEELVHLNSVRIYENDNGLYNLAIGFYDSIIDLSQEDKNSILSNLKRSKQLLYYAVGENGLLPEVGEGAYTEYSEKDNVGKTLVEIITMFIVSSITSKRAYEQDGDLCFLIKRDTSLPKDASQLMTLWGINHFYVAGNKVGNMISRFFSILKNPTSDLQIFRNRYDYGLETDKEFSFENLVSTLYFAYKNGNAIGSEKFSKLFLVATRPRFYNVKGVKTLIPTDVLNTLHLDLSNLNQDES